jgi:serine phosphatase RsbU (regulator of sigma subunit)
MGSDHYMAMTAIRFNDTQMKIAGKHQDIIIYRGASNKTETISTQGTWLGITDDIEDYLVDTSTTLDIGDIVLLFTDGITEATNLKNEMYGQKRLEHCLNQYADLPVGKLIKKIIKDVLSFQEKQLDDITLLAIKKISQA